MAKIKVKLRDMNLRGETVHTVWGHVTFSAEGLADLEVDEADLPLLVAQKWLQEPLVTSQEVPEGAAGEGEGATGEGAAGEGEGDDVAGEGAAGSGGQGFDTSDSGDSTPPQGSKKAKSNRR